MTKNIFHFLLFPLGILTSLFVAWCLDHFLIYDQINVNPNIYKKWNVSSGTDVPIFYRIPKQPSNILFSRRKSRQIETRNILQQMAEKQGYLNHPYRNKKKRQITYGKYGFRGPILKKPPDIAILGSSFTEAGFEVEENTWVGWLKKDFGFTSSNYGVSFIAGFSVFHYLKQYVLPSKPKHVVWIFSERRDIQKVSREFNYFNRKLKLNRLMPDSFFKYVNKNKSFFSIGIQKMMSMPKIWINTFQSSSVRTNRQIRQPVQIRGFEQKVHLSSPPHERQVKLAKPLLLNLLKEMKKATTEHGAILYLLYIPSRDQIFMNFIEDKNLRIKLINKTYFNQTIREYCESLDIVFLDTTSALQDAVKNRILIVNPIYDLHLNAEGMRIGSKVLGSHLRSKN